jgi:hypothetical protein
VIVPTVELPPDTLSTDHVTPVFVVPATVAVNCCFCFSVNGARVGFTVTVTAAIAAKLNVTIVKRRESLKTRVRSVIAHQKEFCSPQMHTLKRGCPATISMG